MSLGLGVGRKTAAALAIPLFLATTVTCTRSPVKGDEAAAAAAPTGDLKADLDAALAMRVFFAHQSVGGNLLTGVATLAKESGRELHLTELAHDDPVPRPGWLHAFVGHNGAPKTKVDDFVSTMQRKALKPDLAFMKFCYVDFDPDTDVAGVFAYYERALTALKRDRPDVRFAHVTVPLRVRPNDLKSKAKRLVGRDVAEDLANAKRGEFNRRLREAFPSDPIFDLARGESTKPDGTRESFEHEGKTYYSLDPGYTEDGGHLDARGQRVLAAEMIRFVARAGRAAVVGEPLGASP
jgi:hypothetical protein